MHFNKIKDHITYSIILENNYLNPLNDEDGRPVLDDDLHVTEICYDKFIDCTKSIMNYCAANGYLDIVKFLHYNRTEGCTTDAMDYAASKGNIEVIKFLYYNRNEGCSFRAMSFASQKGYREVVKFLREHYGHVLEDKKLRNYLYSNYYYMD